VLGVLAVAFCATAIMLVSRMARSGPAGDGCSPAYGHRRARDRAAPGPVISPGQHWRRGASPVRSVRRSR
jgi:hypothetical protein